MECDSERDQHEEEQQLVDGEYKGEKRGIVIRIVRSLGPLFVCEDTTPFLYMFPQAQKKHYSGGHLSIEELEYLSESFTITFIQEEDARRRTTLRERHVLSCRVYRYLTREMGLQLRHGSQFGAAFIGYRNIDDHGDCLVYLGPLSRLEAIAAARVACSVAKESLVVSELQDGSGGFSVDKLGVSRGGVTMK